MSLLKAVDCSLFSPVRSITWDKCNIRLGSLIQTPSVVWSIVQCGGGGLFGSNKVLGSEESRLIVGELFGYDEMGVVSNL